MALDLERRYAGRSNPASLDYPSGSFKNRTNPDSRDGMILEKDWANDFLGSRDAILQAAGLTADGDVETATNSQVKQALDLLYGKSASLTEKGKIQLAGDTDAKDLADALKAISPSTLGYAMRSHVLGMGQSWRDVLADRSLGTTFTNTTGRTIIAYVTVQSYTATPSVMSAVGVVNGVELAVVQGAQMTTGGVTVNSYLPIILIIPSGATYLVKAGTQFPNTLIHRWAELLQ